MKNDTQISNVPYNLIVCRKIKLIVSGYITKEYEQGNK